MTDGDTKGKKNCCEVEMREEHAVTVKAEEAEGNGQTEMVNETNEQTKDLKKNKAVRKQTYRETPSCQ